MKIGIITIHRSQNNYGAALQAFALWKYVTSLGFDCEIIDLYRPIHIGFQASRVHLPLRKKEKRTIKSFFKNIKGLFTKSKKQKTKRILTPEAVQRFEEFNSLIKYSHPYFSVDSLYDNPPEYDVYITGSDQVWNPTMPYCIEPYFLNFVTNGGRKLSYAARRCTRNCFLKKIQASEGGFLLMMPSLSEKRQGQQRLVKLRDEIMSFRSVILHFC